MKRLFDIIASFILLVMLSPLLGIIALVVLVDDGCPIIYKQERIGLDGKVFMIRKFRTMVKDTPLAATNEFNQAEQYITDTGKFLRRTSLDELPQLINILEGTMSFVGPRPLIPQEKEMHKARLRDNVYSVRPGITGLAQISGRDMVDDQYKRKYDAQYIKNQSFWLDIKIMIQTVFVVLGAKGFAEGSDISRRKKAKKKKTKKK